MSSHRRTMREGSNRKKTLLKIDSPIKSIECGISAATESIPCYLLTFILNTKRTMIIVIEDNSIEFHIFRFYCITQMIRLMSQTMKSQNKSPKPTNSKRLYCRCLISFHPHRCTIMHKKPFTKQALGSYSWPSNGRKIFQGIFAFHICPITCWVWWWFRSI